MQKLTARVGRGRGAAAPDPYGRGDGAAQAQRQVHRRAGRRPDVLLRHLLRYGSFSSLDHLRVAGGSLFSTPRSLVLVRRRHYRREHSIAPLHGHRAREGQILAGSAVARSS